MHHRHRGEEQRVLRQLAQRFQRLVQVAGPLLGLAAGHLPQVGQRAVPRADERRDLGFIERGQHDVGEARQSRLPLVRAHAAGYQGAVARVAACERLDRQARHPPPVGRRLVQPVEDHQALPRIQRTAHQRQGGRGVVGREERRKVAPHRLAQGLLAAFGGQAIQVSLGGQGRDQITQQEAQGEQRAVGPAVGRRGLAQPARPPAGSPGSS